MNSVSSDFSPLFVVPRYGEDIVGGAEELARRFAEELLRRGTPVTVATTCARDHHTWSNHYPEGSHLINGVRVIRFKAETKIADHEIGRIGQIIASGEKVDEKDEKRWLLSVVSSPDLIEFLRLEGRAFSHIILLPYLYGTTYLGAQIYPEKSYIIPCLHDEPYAYLSSVRETLLSVKGLIFNSNAEMSLAKNILGEGIQGSVVGLGFSRPRYDAAAFFNRYPIRGDFILYAGRREEGKQTPLLIRYFRRYLLETGGDLSLVLIGSGKVGIPYDSLAVIHDLGMLTQREKWDCYAASFVFCQPSVNESFSIVLLESWLCGKPCIVNGQCAVTADHVRRSGGGIAFNNYEEFAEGLALLLENRSLAYALGEAGRRYVLSEYNWDSVIARLKKALGVP